MTGAAKTVDKLEEKARRNPLLRGTEAGTSGELKNKYAEHRGFDIEEGEGYLGAKEKHEAREAAKEAAASQAHADAVAKAKSDAEFAAATEKSHTAQRDALKRKGRRASILTSSQGTDQLGVPG